MRWLKMEKISRTYIKMMEIFKKNSLSIILTSKISRLYLAIALLIFSVAIVSAEDIIVKSGNINATNNLTLHDSTTKFYRSGNAMRTDSIYGLFEFASSTAGNNAALKFFSAGGYYGMFSVANTATTFLTNPYQPIYFEPGLNRVMTITNESVGIGTSSPSYPLHVSGNTSGISIYAEANISAGGYIDHTVFPDADYDALIEIKKIKSDGKGNLDHTTLPSSAKAIIKKPIFEEVNETWIYEGNVYSKTIQNIVGYKEEEGRNIGNMISINTVALQQLISRIEILEDELCEKDSSYEFCK